MQKEKDSLLPSRFQFTQDTLASPRAHEPTSPPFLVAASLYARPILEVTKTHLLEAVYASSAAVLSLEPSTVWQVLVFKDWQN